MVPCSERLAAHLLDAGWQLHDSGNTAQANALEQAAQPAGAPEAAPADGGRSPKRRRTQPLLAVPLDGEHEVEGALEVLRFMYVGQLSEGLTPLQLLMTRKLAQYLLCSSCSEACSNALMALTNVSPDAAMEACTSPHLAVMLHEPELAGFVAACATALVQRLNAAVQPGSNGAPSSSQVADALVACCRSTLLVMRNQRLRAAFFSLSIPAWQHLLEPMAAAGGEADEHAGATALPVDCEETVLLLLDTWVQRNGPVVEVQRQLRKLLRPLQLSATYVHFLLHKFGWLGLSSSELEVLRFAWGASQARGGTKQSFARLQIFKDEPQWLLKPRKCVPPSREDTIVTAVWTREEVTAWLDRARAKANAAASASNTQTGQSHRFLAGPKVYCGGLQLRLDLTLTIAPTVPPSDGLLQVKAGIYLTHHLPAINGVGHVTECMTLTPRHVISVKRCGAAGDLEYRNTTGECVKMDHGRGRSSFFMPSGALDIASWEPFLVQGAVRATAALGL